MRRGKKLESIECEVCGSRDKSTLHQHHIVERTELHTDNSIMNLAVLCSNCHNKVHANEIEIIGLYPSTQLPYARTLIYKKDGKSNVEGINEPYYVPKQKSTKIWRKK